MTKIFIFCQEVQNSLTLLAEDLSKQGVIVEISTGKAGKTAWQYRRYLSEAVDKCDFMIVGLTKVNRKGDDFIKDVEGILDKGKPVIPVLIDSHSTDLQRFTLDGLTYSVINIVSNYPAGLNQILEIIKSQDQKQPQPHPPGDEKRRVEILPKRVRGFINREEEINKISALLLQREFVQIRGLGGIGKTSLATEIAYKLKDQYEDGVLWISALDSPSTDDILNSIGLAFKLEVTAMPTSQKKFFLKLQLSNFDYLLVVDNVQVLDPVEQVYDLVAHGAILCTSRPQTIMPAMKIIDLDVLEKEHAVKLFQEIYGSNNLESNDSETVEDICIEKLDGYPLAIELAAKQANIQKLSVRKLSSRLEKTLITPLELPALGSITASLLSTVDQLPPTARELFVGMGTFAGRKINKSAIEFVTEKNDIEDMLYILQGYSLINIEKDNAVLHPLIKELATHLAGHDQELFIKMVEYYVQFTDRYSKEHSEIERERTNIDGAVIWSYQNQRYGLMVSIVDNLLGPDAYYSFWAMRGYWEQGIKILRYAINASRYMGDAYKEARYNLELGLFLYWLGDHKNARVVSKNAELIFEKIESIKELVRTCWLQGYIEDDEDNYELASNLYKRSLALSQAAGDKVLEMTSMELVGVSEYHRGNYDTARNFIENSLRLSQLEGYKAGISRDQRRLAAVARIQATRELNPEKREIYLQEARQLLEECLQLETSQRSRARALRQLGMIDLIESKLQDAEHHLNESLETFVKLGNRRGIGATYFNVGNLRLAAGKLEEAKDYYNKSLEIAREFNTRMGMALNMRQLALVARKQNSNEYAQTLLHDSIELLSKINSPYLDETLRLKDE